MDEKSGNVDIWLKVFENKLPLPYLPFPDALVMPCQHAINVDRHSSKKLQAGARLSPRAHRYTAN